MPTLDGSLPPAPSEDWARARLKDYYSLERYPWNGRTYRVFRRGSGPPVIVLHELGGITPPVVYFAERVVNRGFTVFMPSLLGNPGRRAGRGRMVLMTARLCLSSEFTKLATEEPSPVTDWLRHLARSIHAKMQRPIGVVGMCLTGGFGLAMAAEPCVTAPVVAQPSLPFAFGRRRARDLGIPQGDLERLLGRDDLEIFGVRFSHDRISPCARFARLHDEFGPRFRRHELDSGPCNPNGTSWAAHATLTSDIFDNASQDASKADLEAVFEDMIRFLEQRLAPGPNTN